MRFRDVKVTPRDPRQMPVKEIAEHIPAFTPFDGLQGHDPRDGGAKRAQKAHRAEMELEHKTGGEQYRASEKLPDRERPNTPGLVQRGGDIVLLHLVRHERSDQSRYERANDPRPDGSGKADADGLHERS